MPIALRIRLSAMMFLQYFMFGAWLVTFGTYMSKGLSFDAIIGTAYGMQGIAAMVASLVVGALADRFFSAEKVLAVLSLLSGLTLFALANIHVSRELFLLTTLCHFLCFVPTVALTNTIALSSLSDRARQFPTIRMVGTLGWIFAGLLVGSITGAAATALPLQIGAVTGIFLALYAPTLPHTPPLARGQPLNIASLVGFDFVTRVRDRNFWIFSASVLLIAIPLSFYFAYCNNFLVEAGARIEVFGHFFEPAAIQTLGQGAELIFLLFLPPLLLRFGVKGVLLIGMLAWSVRYALFAYGFDGQTANMAMLTAGVLLHGVCYDFFFVAGQIYVDERFEPQLRTRAQAFLVTINMGIGILLGSNLANLVYGLSTHTATEHDWRIIWLIPAGVALAAGAFFAVFFNPKSERVSAD